MDSQLMCRRVSHQVHHAVEELLEPVLLIAFRLGLQGVQGKVRAIKLNAFSNSLVPSRLSPLIVLTLSQRLFAASCTAW